MWEPARADTDPGSDCACYCGTHRSAVHIDLRADRYDEAEDDARKALELDPDDPTAKQALEIVHKLRPPPRK